MGNPADRMYTVAVDRIEGAFAVLELCSGETVDFPLADLPSDVQEGDELEIQIRILRERRRQQPRKHR